MIWPGKSIHIQISGTFGIHRVHTLAKFSKQVSFLFRLAVLSCRYQSCILCIHKVRVLET